jgi:hypothetical protein
MEVALLQRVHKEAVKVTDDLQTNLARKIVAEYADARKRGEKKGQSGRKQG